ncbi:MAG: oxygen-independent coproporphyrinogen III oxidase-like protein [Gammaproteobacteria bacterium]|nr:oxygen-independent coproporphyrinogen III oxidase-like protein [Gammaproteobacteria bacterium]NVK89254.1 oxygen-independent coproporphyrinogen III oxidase-like protein [Gammaproteobacteria bacterium]
MMTLTTLPPLALYIHVPWCVRKCPYCDFNSHQAPNNLPEQEYLAALVNDLTEQLPQVWGRSISSIFIGGGTPSLLSGQGIDHLLAQIRALIPFQPDIEITLEANPGTAEAKKFADFFQAGVNRLSLGIQSFNDGHLQKLGRIHGSRDAYQAIEFAHQAGFTRFNIDLMHGLPEQSVAQAEFDLQQALAAGGDHLSWYQLTLEPNTLFYAKPPQLPADDQLVDIQEAGEAIIAAGGFQRYEISAFARQASSRSRHNLNYWTFGDYLAIGAGAHGKITLPAENQIVRYHQRRSPKDYLDPQQSFTRERKVIEVPDLPLEFMMNVLRLTTPVPKAWFFERTGLPLNLIDEALARAQSLGLMETSSDSFITTTQGSAYLNDLLALFMPDNLAIPAPIKVKNIS